MIGLGPCGLNTGILNNKGVVDEIKMAIGQYITYNKNGQVDPTILWDMVKAIMRGRCIVCWCSP
uniref:Uncharacterized protein n=1 Tax=Echeneis naucrates TaxID=173247 RepID=A0A665V6H6_ECHNA